MPHSQIENAVAISHAHSIVLAEPQRFVRRSISRSSVVLRRRAPSGSTLTTENQSGSAQRAQHEINELGSRAHYNRLVGRLVQEEFHPENPTNINWSQQDTEWMMDILDFAHDDLDHFIRTQLLGPAQLEFLERPSLDLLELPDRNEF